MKENISKANYISSTYTILSKEGIAAVTIRRLADELNCNSANLYRYFNGLDELIVYASLKYLKSYINEASSLFTQIEDSIELHYAVWECFSRYTFSYPEIFNNLFWGKFSPHLDQITRDYYSIFPEELNGIDKSMFPLFLSGDFDYRDYLMLARSVREGRFTEEQAKFLNITTMNLYKGFFKGLLDSPEKKDYRIIQETFLEILRRIFSLELHHGSALDSPISVPEIDS